MRCLLIAILAVALASAIGACAEETIMLEGMLEEGQAAAFDLDGDGRRETVKWSAMPDMDLDHVVVTVAAPDGTQMEWTSGSLYGARVYVRDIDEDGASEIFVTGDEMSDDYLTYCLRPDGGTLKQLSFENGMRGGEGGPFVDCGYGRLTDTDGNALTLTGSQDVLGTYFGSRTYKLEDGRFVFDDDGLWHFTYDEDDDWTWKQLTLSRPLSVSLEGGETAVLEEGTKLRITASDCRTVAHFMTQDGRKGVLPIAVNEEKGWGFVVEGIDEEDLFESVPYSD